MPRHNLPCSFFSHPDSRAAAFAAKRLAIFVLAYGMGNTIRNSKALPINADTTASSPSSGHKKGSM